MPRFLPFLAILLVCVPAHANDGIEWERDLDSGLLRAAHEGRPVLICLNALTNEAANIRLATRLYPSAAWGRSSRGYVAFIAGPHHGETGQAVLGYVMRRFGSDLISPQHFILDPDGDLAYRKPYYEGVVGPALLEDRLARISPPVAYARAAIDRAARIEQVAAAPSDTLAAEAEAWLRENDGFAVVGLLGVLDDEFDGARRLTLIRSLAKADPNQAPVVAYGAEERTSYPEDEPKETLAWLETLLAVDRARGVVALGRALARCSDPHQRDVIFDTCAPGGFGRLGKDEQALVVEALLLANDPRGRPLAEDLVESVDEALKDRVARALGEVPSLSDAIRYPTAGGLYRAFVTAPPADVQAHRPFITEQLRTSPYERVRVAAAIALLHAGGDDVRGELAARLAAAVFDPIEGPDTRRELARRLGTDPGPRVDAWRAAIEEHLK